ncbi:inhibitor of nuclear factor kappa-B kinase subunit beta [Solea senegalensis]|uniref:Inhibitor of nuclear factor kappa-B kinase subunit beta n=1 Tax=Solea senegalensis TaxID=28829 RepID=A0AAV6PY97_SOLSE|nr:inhibitor of nuclear factor kappa-B kinase subunit beta [Solea senegalensis]
MASRKRFGNLPKQRTGLRSQRRQQQEDVAADEADPAWDTVEDDEGMAGAWAASAAEATATGGLEPELLTMMRHFLAAQDRREEDLLAEIRGLRMSLPPRPPPAPSLPVPATPSTVTASSPRLQLPTPAPRRGHLETPSEVPSLRFSDAHDRGELQRPEWRLYGEPKIPPYQRGEDIENYLLRFERIAKTWQWPETEWACRLVPLLSGKALEAYTAMDEERPEQRTKEEVGEAIILEQLLCVLPSEVRTWVKEHEPADGLTAAKLGLQYLNARRGGPPTRQSAATRPALLPLPPRHARRESPSGLGNTNQFTAHLAAGKSFVCYYCQQPGHKASVCPIRKAKVTGACYAPRLEAPLETSGEGRLQRYKTVVINGQQVTALLDSGSFTSCIRQHLVPLASCDYTRTVDIMCVHGDEHKYPTADLTVSINEQPYMLNAGVVEKLPVDALLGWDLPVLLDLLLETETPVETDSGENGGGGVVEGNVTCPVITRAQAKTGVPLLTDSDNSLCEGGTPEPKAEAAEAQPLSDFDNSLFEGGTKGLRKSRRQRRFEKQLRSAVPDSKNLLSSTMWDVPDNISMLQSGDDTLKNLFAKNLVNWSDDCEAAFSTLKAHLCSSPVLRSPDFKQRFLVQVDASAIGLGAVLAQGIPGEEFPILYLSRKLQPRETRYSTVEKEGLAIKWTLESLRYYLLGREFDLETDHRALTWINTMKDHNSRLTRWYLSLQPFRFSIRHRSGKINVVADCLSRLPYTDNLPEEGDDVTE